MLVRHTPCSGVNQSRAVPLVSVPDLSFWNSQPILRKVIGMLCMQVTGPF